MSSEVKVVAALVIHARGSLGASADTPVPCMALKLQVPY